jgi:hypothetical protein
MMGGSAEPYHYRCSLAHADWRAGVTSHDAGPRLTASWIVDDVWESQEALDPIWGSSALSVGWLTALL